MATIETRTKGERKQQRESIPATISPECTPVTWKSWPETQPAQTTDDGPYCPPHGGFFHIVNGKE